MNKILSILLVLLILPLIAFAKVDAEEVTSGCAIGSSCGIELVVGDEYEVREKNVLTFDLSAITICNKEPIYSVQNLPDGATFDGNTFYWEPSYEAVQHVPQPVRFIRELFGFKKLAAAYELRFTAHDSCGTGTDTEKVVIWVHDVNRSPRIKDGPVLVVSEGDLAHLTPRVRDADGDKLRYDFEQPFNDRGYWQTQIGDAGDYSIDLEVRDAYGGSASHTFRVRVVKAVIPPVNQAPVLDEIGDKEVCAGDVLEFDVTASDVDGDRLTYYVITSAVQVPWTFDENTRHFYWATTQVDSDKVVFGVTDGNLFDEERVNINVIDCQVPPQPEEKDSEKRLSTLSAYSFDNQVKAGETLYINTHVRNLGEVREHIRARVVIPALDVYISKYFDLDEKENTGKIIEVKIPSDARKGEYLALVDLTSGSSSDNEYVIFEVV